MAVSLEEKSKSIAEPKPPGNDLAMVAVIVLWGIIFSDFPAYADIKITYAVWFFKILGYACYIIGFLGAIVGLSNLREAKIEWYIHKFIQNIGFGLFFLVLAYFAHMASIWPINTIWSFILRLVVLIFAVIGILLIGTGIPYIFFKKFEGISFEISARILVAIVSLLAAAIPLLKSFI